MDNIMACRKDKKNLIMDLPQLIAHHRITQISQDCQNLLEEWKETMTKDYYTNNSRIYKNK